MKILVTYFSQTGNTLKIAEAIFSEIHDEKELKPLNEVPDLDKYDLTFVGFPIIQFRPPRAVRTFLGKYTKGKKIAMFVTHASWNSPELASFLELWLSKCKAAAAGSKLEGFFDCQGELAETSAELFLQSEFPEIRHFGSLRSMTVGHPNKEDICNAKIFARAVLEKMK